MIFRRAQSRPRTRRVAEISDGVQYYLFICAMKACLPGAGAEQVLYVQQY